MAKTKLTPADYEAFLVKDGRGYVALEPYAGAKTKILHQCPVSEDHQWSARPTNIKEGQGCPYCSPQKIKQTTEQYSEWLNQDRRGYVALEPYAGAHKQIKHQCPVSKDHQWSAAPSNIKTGTGCPHCSGHVPQDYKEFLQQDGRGITALEPYVSGHTTIMHQCPVSKDHQWSARPCHIKQGKGCPHCDRTASDANVFYIWENADDAGVYKVGITSKRCAEDRIVICTRKNGMTANVILKLAVSDARELERKALEIGEPADYPSTIDGYTEFRRYTDQELGEVYRMAVHAA